jgi:ElaB/YqjD/DUF883 family membrane-anchored ribosome-binding protein
MPSSKEEEMERTPQDPLDPTPSVPMGDTVTPIPVSTADSGKPTLRDKALSARDAVAERYADATAAVRSTASAAKERVSTGYAEAAARARIEADNLRMRAADLRASANAAAIRARDEVKRQAETDPVKVILISAGAGFVVGLMLRVAFEAISESRQRDEHVYRSRTSHRDFEAQHAVTDERENW